MKKSAGILLYRFRQHGPEFMLVHPGGPFWTNKDLGAWSIPKGEFNDDEDPLAAAKREFQEETGKAVKGKFITLPPVMQNTGKQVYAFACEAEFDADCIKSNVFAMEWPPKTGRQINVPEVDKAAWFTEGEAREKIVKGQVKLLDLLKEALLKRD